LRGPSHRISHHRNRGRSLRDRLLLSLTIGIVVFDIVEGKQLGGVVAVQDDSYTKLQAKLLQHKTRVSGRQLWVPIYVLTFAPAVKDSQRLFDHRVSSLRSCFMGLLEWLDNSAYAAAAAVIQAISTIKKGKKRREAQNPTSRGRKLQALEVRPESESTG
jgi:hypothetical protein